MRLPHDLPLGPKAIWKANCDEFVVHEIPAYEPSGQGEHIYVEVTRRGMTTPFLIQQLGRHFRLPAIAFGHAGLKDRHSVARQRISIHLRQDLPDPPALDDLLEWRLLGRHENKLKPGHLQGNRFHLVVRGSTAELTRSLEERQAILKAGGWANYYGPQRFGRDGDNCERGRAALRSGRRGDEFALAGLVAHLFNRVLEQRIRAGAFARLEVGDVCGKLPDGGLFEVSDAALEQPRLDRFEISPTGPIFGYKMRSASGLPGQWEAQILTEEGLTLEQFRALHAPGSRRRMRLAWPALSWQPHPHGLELTFDLPSGSYASTLLSHLFELEESEVDSGNPQPPL